MVANLASNSHFSNHCSFQDMTFFMIFFQNFSENLDIKNFTKLEIRISVVNLCRGTLKSCEFCLPVGLRILPPNRTAQNLVVFQI